MIAKLVEQGPRDALREVLDPETGLNLVDLGLICDVVYRPEQQAAEVLMTFTTSACPASGVMRAAVERRLCLVPGVQAVTVRVTFEPPWTPDRISAAGRVQLGW